ncbi:hypothetical protein [Actinoplanes regularis]|uniref:Uncharacterized protein n=1 Tax=Actinoplanes regularis TaxID=52697 RepID=A0A239E1S1_9ACTN|nr:hypothetical protein [Actinoplanes regularis]GIE88898.1 hypothetical protein Are01nite_53780 [Actinoplanes regularis]SNS38321.1 hypothetical protein SAMN06264365_114203 [Actinoplanes regularis]
MAGRISARALDTAVVGTAVLAALTLLAAAWLAVPALPPLPLGVAVLGAFAAGAAAIANGRVARRLAKHGFAGRPFVAGHWRLFRIITAALFVAVLAVVVTTIVTQPDPWPAGQPGIVDGHFYLNNHGALAPITESEYRQALKSNGLLFLCFALLFDCVALLTLVWNGRK